MFDILPRFRNLENAQRKTTARQLRRIVVAILAMTGRVAQLGLSRWAGKGGSYRTIHRFFHTRIDWLKVQWMAFIAPSCNENKLFIVVGDETVVGKAGKTSHGVDQFFSSTASGSITIIYGRSFASPAPPIRKRATVYSLRFQIEYTFRDAKQYFGLEDFMGVKEVSIVNAVGLSFFMVNLSRSVLEPLRALYPEAGVNDLKTAYRALHYVSEVLKYVSENACAISCSELTERVCRAGMIHRRQNGADGMKLAA